MGAGEDQGHPPHLTAICTHLLVRARDRQAQADFGMRVAVSTIEGSGLSVDTIDRALRLLLIDPRILEMEERAIGTVLTALQAPGVEMEVLEVVERRTDEPKHTYAERIRRQGWIAAVLNRPADPPVNSNEAPLWLEGFNAFRTALRAYERSSKPRTGQPVAA